MSVMNFSRMTTTECPIQMVDALANADSSKFSFEFLLDSSDSRFDKMSRLIRCAAQRVFCLKGRPFQKESSLAVLSQYSSSW